MKKSVGRRSFHTVDPSNQERQVLDMDADSLFDLSHSLAGEYLSRFRYPWEALEGLSAWIAEMQKTLSADYREVSVGVFVHVSAKIAPTACLRAPCIIGARAELRHGAFIRGSAVIGEDAVVGNSTEIKNAILFDGAQLPHFNYAGDSILGYRAHMGAGAIASNVRLDKAPIRIRVGEETLETGRKKCGAMLGDFAEIGCHAVLNPGTVIGRHAKVYPLSSVRGTVPENGIFGA